MKDGDVYYVDGPFKGTSSSNQDLVEFIDMDVNGSDVHRYQRTGETTVIDPDPSELRAGRLSSRTGTSGPSTNSPASPGRAARHSP
jgi:hypothetical protein